MSTRFAISSSLATLGLSVFALSTSPSAAAQSLSSLSAKPVVATGNLLGEIRNSNSIAQMGATVLLYDRNDNLIRRALSTQEGRFAFAALAPGIYSLRVTLASFLPALKRNITVMAGTESLLNVNLATLVSSIEIVPGSANNATLMSDEWKWVLRGSQSTRPVLRLVDLPAPSGHSPAEATLFSETTGVVRLSTGDNSLMNTALQQDMGTAFAVETSVSGDTKVRLSGNFGYAAASGLPTAGFRTTYMHERNGAPGPQISLTMRQAYFPAAIGGAQGNTPLLRTASLSTIDSLDILDALHLDYGFSMDSVMLYGHMNYFSPFARATYNLGQGGMLKAAYSAGFSPVELLSRSADNQPDPSQDLSALALAPRISRRDDRAAVERNKSYEAAYEIVDGHRKWSASVFRDETANAVFLMSGSDNFAGSSNLLPDFNSRGTVFNAGNFQRNGVSVGMTQTVNDRINVTFAGGEAGALVASTGNIDATADTIRAQIHNAQRAWATVRADYAVPVTGTRVAASYGWTDFRSLMPSHLSLTSRMNQEVGWNVSCRQPLPRIAGTRMEFNAEVRNILAQGYLRVTDGTNQAQLTNTPRSLRGGLSFIF